MSVAHPDTHQALIEQIDQRVRERVRADGVDPQREPSVFDAAKHFNDRPTIGYSNHTIGVKSPPCFRLSSGFAGQECNPSCFFVHKFD